MTFEEWFKIKENEMILGGFNDREIKIIKQLVLCGWRESRKQVVIDLPDEEKVRPYDDYNDGYNSGVEACMIELEDKGFKVNRK